MYNEIIKNIPIKPSGKMHLAIFSEPVLTFLLNGQKIIESRFSQNKIAPYDKVKENDIVIVKKSGGDVVAYFTVGKVRQFDLTKTPIEEIKQKYNNKLCVDDTFWQLKKAAKYATLMDVKNLTKIKSFPITKKGMQSWIVLN